MTRLRLLASLALSLAVLSGRAAADDSEELKRLKAENELLSLKLKLAEERVATLKKELELAKDGPKPGGAAKDGGKKSLTEIIEEGLIISGEYVSAKTGGKGTITLSIKDRDGKKVNALAVTKYMGGAATDHTLEGTVVNNELTLTSVGNAVNFKMTVRLLKGTSLQGTWSYTTGQGGTIGFDLTK